MGRGRKKRNAAAEPEGAAGPIFREVEAPIDASEMMATFRDAADKTENAQNLEDELTRVKATVKEAKGAADMAVRSALHLAKTGKGLIRVEVIEVVDEQAGIVRLMRKDDPTIEVDKRALTAGELQALSVGKTPLEQISDAVAKIDPVNDLPQTPFDFDANEPAPAITAEELAAVQ